MDKKILAIAAAAVLVVAAAAVFFIANNSDKDSDEYDSGAFNLIGRVNTEGSGLYIAKSVLDASASLPTNKNTNTPFYSADGKLSSANRAAWGGLILGDPGATSIQHTQLASIASSVGLEFKQYTSGASTSADTLYYVTNLSNYGVIIADTDIQGGIIWEPQYERVVQEASSKYSPLALTNALFPGHTCCVVAANHDWLQSNSDVAVKFLAGYVDGVNFVNRALANPGGEDYAWLVDYAKRTVAAGTLNEREVRDALACVTYLYADDANGSLGKLTTDVASLATDLKNLGFITSSSFNDADALAKAFVDDSYLKDAAAGKASKEGKDSVKVAVIDGDIHQIAIHVAAEKDFFKGYGLTVNLSKGSNGGDIATLLMSNDVQIGFLGAPPATINTINGGHIIV